MLGLICFGEIHCIKIFVRNEGHWECEKYAIMLGCLCNALLKEEVATHLQNGEP